MSSYYGRPILKEPVWTPEVPVYFFAGGLAGASAVLSLAARAAGNERLARASLGVAFAGITASPPLLISDLGRPERFLNMLRVFKVTSPMSVGSWVLAASGGTITAAAGCEALGVLPRAKLAAATASALLGPALATYTGALLANTAIPAWHEARRELPFVFGASAAASAGAAATLLLPDDGPARRLAIGASAVELAATELMTRRLGFLAEPYRTGRAGRLARVAKAATLTGAALLAVRRNRLGSALILGGSLALRFAVVEAGHESARDPRYTVVPQRARLGSPE